MAELQRNLEKLSERVDRMGLRVARAVYTSLRAISQRDIAAGEGVDEDDSRIDQKEVEIEQECIALLALYQPTAIDLRRICCLIKVNSDLERIGDHCTNIAEDILFLATGEIMRHSATLKKAVPA